MDDTTKNRGGRSFRTRASTGRSSKTTSERSSSSITATATSTRRRFRFRMVQRGQETHRRSGDRARRRAVPYPRTLMGGQHRLPQARNSSARCSAPGRMTYDEGKVRPEPSRETRSIPTWLRSILIMDICVSTPNRRSTRVGRRQPRHHHPHAMRPTNSRSGRSISGETRRRRIIVIRRELYTLPGRLLQPGSMSSAASATPASSITSTPKS